MEVAIEPNLLGDYCYLKHQDLSRQLAESERIFNKAVERADTAYKKGDLNSVVAWAKIASHFAFVRHPGFYTSAKLENLLLKVAQEIEKEPRLDVNLKLQSKDTDIGKMRFLHVITESYGTGGHSSFIACWIKNSNANSIHSIITTANNRRQPEMLVSAIIESGGWGCSLPDVSQNLIEQSLFLRQIARNWADVVVLFVHPFDPLPIVAFGVEGGPPIIYGNHADHAFWLGTSIADVVADYHYFGGLLSSKHRGIPQSKLLPIPLLKNSSKRPRNVGIRKKYGLRDDEIMLLTVGRAEKFLPFGNYDFLEVVVRVLKRYPNAKLIAVGPKPQGRWEKASALVDGRIKAVGTVGRSVLEAYYDAADLYVASFPCGSETALLEAGLHNLPVIGLHLKELPHISGWDDVAFEKLGIRVSSIGEFTESLDLMINDYYSCHQKAMLVKESIEREHCSPGWNTYLDNVLQLLPSQHSIRKPEEIKSQKEYADHYFAYVDSEMLFNELLEHSFSRLVRVYAKHLPKTQAVNAQADCFLRALPKVDGVKSTKEYLSNLREFVKFTFKAFNS